MSDLSALSHEYSASASFAEDVNRAAITLKKAQSLEPKLAKPSKSEVRSARDQLADVLESLLHELQSDHEREPEPSKLIPEEIIERVRKQYSNRLFYFVEDLGKAIEVLRSDEDATRAVFEVIDSLASLADDAASTAFQRLWRR